MRIAVTGANGFVGRAVMRGLIERGQAGALRLVDRDFDIAPDCETLAIDIADPGAAARIVDGMDCVIHLAALPGAAARADPRLSQHVNLMAPLALMERLEGRRLVYASSIAVFGSAFPALVDDNTPAAPDSTYGTHKRMVELAFADMVRRGKLSGLALRLPGIVARPSSAEGFGSSFLSEIFHAARHGPAFEIPVSPEATTWLMSVRKCAENLVDAALSDRTQADAINLPAVHLQMADLVSHLAQIGDTEKFSYRPDPALERMFGSFPPLATDHAERLGFRSDGDISSLIRNVFAHD